MLHFIWTRKMKLIKNKRGSAESIFMAVLLLTVFVLMGLSIWSFYHTKDKTEFSFNSPIQFMEMKRNEIVFENYVESSLKLSATNSYNELLKSSGTEKKDTCLINSFNGESYISWNRECKPEQEKINSAFLEKTKENLISYLKLKEFTEKEYYKIEDNFNISLSGDSKNLILSTIEPIKFRKRVEDNFVNITMESSFNLNKEFILKEFNVELTIFESAFSFFESKIEECKAEQKQENPEIIKYDINTIKDCLSKFNLESWTYGIETSENNVYIQLISKNNIFISNKNIRESLFNPILRIYISIN
ncbi:hypothetical protein CO154_01450 [Candidatus Pacearchaeota archaeon CG_4_9_14_3_um_filter_31_7]|nr:MAG: hypothetical protein CO154_01450 [Candidatus Pacearchaeota archaeon CG_4_9_14_3_um_filter_31_7]